MTDPSSDIELWKTLATAAPDYLCIVDRELRYVWVNRVHPGLSLDDVIGHSIGEFTTPVTAAKARACLDEVSRTGAPGQYVAESIVDGEHRWLSCRVQPVDSDPDQFLIATHDMTDQRIAELEVRKSAAALRGLVQMYPHIILLIEPDGTVVDTNDITASVLRTTRGELIGACAWTRMEPAVAAQRQDWASTVIHTHEPLHKLDEHRGRWFDSIAYPILDDDGAVRNIAIISRDITDQRRAEDILREHQARRSHAEKMEALGTLAAGIAHDFNNLLTPIVHNATHAKRANVSDSARQRMLSDIEHAANRAAKLVRQILSHGRDDLDDRRAMDVRATVAEVAELMRATLPAHIKIHVEVPDVALWIDADASRIQQALTNLCINAGQAMPERGSVTLSAALATDRLPVELPAGHYIRIDVRDTGPGIDADVLPRIFEPFYSTKAPDEGSGLGLFVVHGVATSHDGTVTVANTEHGAEFTLWLPARCSKLAEPEPPRGRLPSVTVQRRVLFLDDETIILTAATATLETVGHTVTAFSRAAAALAAFRAAPDTFDVAVLDQRLVDGVGLEVAEQLTQIRPDLPIMLCSGHLPAEVEAACRERGFAVLTKPYDVDELLDAIDSLGRDGAG